MSGLQGRVANQMERNRVSIEKAERYLVEQDRLRRWHSVIAIRYAYLVDHERCLARRGFLARLQAALTQLLQEKP